MNSKEKGIKKAMDNANRVVPEWSELAYKFVKNYVNKRRKPFMAEDVRESSFGVVPEPPHKRAWGGIIRRVACEGLIVRVAFDKVRNETAHHAIASVWKKV